METLDISIITPSYNMLSYLKCCAASIADQGGVYAEHIVIDANSTDGTGKWLACQSQIRFVSEPDKGMYDAVNKGLKMASGNIIAYLNCDEQYLPGTLVFVKNYFTNNPDVDILFGDYLAVNPDGSLIAYKKAFKPRWQYIVADHLYTLTCTMFFRRKIIDDGNYFDANLKAIADSVFVINLLRKGYNAKHARKYFSSFSLTGNNLFLKENAIKEKKRERKKYLVLSILCPIIRKMVMLEKLLNGAYFQRFPFTYSIYTDENIDGRKSIVAKAGSFRLRTK